MSRTTAERESDSRQTAVNKFQDNWLKKFFFRRPDKFCDKFGGPPSDGGSPANDSTLAFRNHLHAEAQKGVLIESHNANTRTGIPKEILDYLGQEGPIEATTLNDGIRYTANGKTARTKTTVKYGPNDSPIIGIRVIYGNIEE